MPPEEKLAIIAGTIFGPLSEAETRVLSAAETGDKALCDAGLSGPRIGDEDASRSRSVRAALLRWLTRDRAARERVDSQGIRISDALVTGELDLTAVLVPFPISFEKCTFDSQITLLDAETRNLEFTGSELVGIVGDRMICRGGIWLNDGCTAHRGITFLGAKIDGDLSCRGGRLNGLSLDGCEINGSIYLDDGFVSHDTVEFRGAVVRGDFACRGGHFEGPKDETAHDARRRDAIDASAITVGGNVYFDKGFLAVGAVLLARAKIAGGLDCDDGKFFNPRKAALSAIFASVGKEVRMGNGFVAEGGVDLNTATVQGPIICTRGRFLNPGSDALILDDAHVRGRVVLEEAFLEPEKGAFVARGCVRMLGARLDGGLQCVGGTFVEKTGNALTADGARIAGSAVLARCTVLGAVSFMMATVSGQFALPGTRILNRGGPALRAQGLTVHGPTLLHNGFKAFGETDISFSTMHRALDCSYCRLSRRSGTALDLSHSTVIGKVNLSNGAYLGDLDFESARIEGDLSFVGASADNPDAQEGGRPQTIALVGATIRGSLEWVGVHLSPVTDVLFTNTRVGALLDEPKSWPELGYLDLRGMTYTTLGEIADVSAARLEWLRRQGPERFSLQPYEELIAWARRNGREQDAVRIAIGRQDDLRKFGQLGPVASGWNWFLGKSMKHGYAPLQVLYAAATFIVIGWIVFGYGNAHGAMLATEADRYPTLWPLVYSLDTFLPIIDLHQERYWLPNSRTALGRAIMIYLWIHISMGWALTTLFVIGFTGLVRKT